MFFNRGWSMKKKKKIMPKTSSKIDNVSKYVELNKSMLYVRCYT